MLFYWIFDWAFFLWNSNVFIDWEKISYFIMYCVEKTHHPTLSKYTDSWICSGISRNPTAYLWIAKTRDSKNSRIITHINTNNNIYETDYVIIVIGEIWMKH